MLCDLDKTEGRRCVLQSPLINDSLSWTCMLVKYQLSSHDVKLTLDLLANGVSNITYTLLANESSIWIPNSDLGSSISIQFTASRYLVSCEDYEQAFVSDVDYVPCSAETGRPTARTHKSSEKKLQN